MKKHFFLVSYFVAFLLQLAVAQTTGQPLIRCGTARYYETLLQQPDFKKKWEANQQLLQPTHTLSISRMAALADTITLVVHVVASAAIQQQVTDAIIQSQVEVLNEDYRGLNADSVRIPAAFKSLYGKSGLVFKLAGTNPLNEPTTGIDRIVTSTTYNQTSFDNVKFTASGGVDAWDPARYLNIWVVSFGNTGVLGISVMPGDPRSLSYHGFVCDYRAFGRGAAYLFSKYNKGRTTTHELGHFFNLFHIWGDDGGACSGTDFPDDAANDDTPNQADATFDNPDPAGIGVVKVDNCSPAPPGIMYQNFMDYTDDVAMVLFTKGQQKRIQNALTLAPDRSPLLSSTAYLAAPVYSRDARIRSIIAPASPLCTARFTPEVILRNSGAQTLTSVKINATLNNEAPVVYNWTGSLASYSEIKVSLPEMNGKTGINTLQIYTSQPNALTDENPANDTTSLTFEVLTAITIQTRIEEDFSAPQFPPAGWKVNNPDGDITWQRNASIGKKAPGSAWLNDWINPVFHRYDDLVTPSFSYSNKDSVFLYFNVAAATYPPPGTPLSDADTLSVLVSKDCGNTFTAVYKKWGKELSTITDVNYPVSNEFFPFDNEWRRDSVNLGTVLSGSESQFQLYFRMSGNFRNNIFLDDISVVTEVLPPALKEKGFLILPTAFQSEFSIWHYGPPTTLQYVNIYNSSGQLVWQRQYSGNANTFITVNLSGKSAGVYFVQLGYEDRRRNVTQRIVKYQ